MEILEGVAVGEVGIQRTINIVDENNVAVNVSTYTVSIKIDSPGSGSSLTLTGTFINTGVDGKIALIFTSAITPTVSGMWTGQVTLTKTGVVARSEPFSMPVYESV